MARMGMEVEGVERIGHGLQSDAQALAALVTRIDALVQRLPGAWQGADAQRFVGQWWPQHRGRLEAARDAVHGLGQSALNNASDQRTTSSTNPGGAGDAGAGGGSAPAPTPTPAPAPEHPRLPSAGGADRYTASIGSVPEDERYQCASWASFRRRELGLKVLGGNGWEQAGRIGLVDPGQAGVGSLVSTGDASNYGHVMVVEERLSDSPLTYRVSEMNTDGNWRVATPEEYRDNSVIRQNADGSWSKSSDGRPFRPMPGPRFSSS